MSKERNIASVVDQLLIEVPKEFNGYERLKKRLDNRLESSRYTAPELMWLRWHEIGQILAEELGTPDTQWKQKVAAIFGDKKS